MTTKETSTAKVKEVKKVATAGLHGGSHSPPRLTLCFARRGAVSSGLGIGEASSIPFSRTSPSPHSYLITTHLVSICCVSCSVLIRSPVSLPADLSIALAIGARVAPVVSVILHIAIVNGQTKELIVLTTTE